MEKFLLTVWEAADVLSVSRSRVYEPLYAEQPVWTGAGYYDPDTGVMLPTWRQALDHLDADPDAGPVHVMRFGTHHDIAGIIAPSPTRTRPDPTTYTLMLLRAVAERQHWRAQYDQAKTRTAVETVDSLSATGPPSGGRPPSPSVAHSSATPDNPPNPGPQDRQSRVSAANPQDRSEATALDGQAGGPTFTTRGRPSPSTQSQANADRRRTGDDHDHE